MMPDISLGNYTQMSEEIWTWIKWIWKPHSLINASITNF